MGKPLTQARRDISALARYCEFYGGAAFVTAAEVQWQRGDNFIEDCEAAFRQKEAGA